MVVPVACAAIDKIFVDESTEAVATTSADELAVNAPVYPGCVTVMTATLVGVMVTPLVQLPEPDPCV